MTPPKPPRKSMMKSSITSSYDVPQPTYEDPDVTRPAVTDRDPSGVIVKPVPRPRSKIQPKTECNTNNNNTVDPINTTSNTTNSVSLCHQDSSYPANYKTPRPIRPPPRPPMSKSMMLSQPTTGADKRSHYVNEEVERTLTPPAASTESPQPPPSLPPKRPPLPSIFYDRPSTRMTPRSEIHTYESEQSRHSSISSVQQSPVSPAFSDEEGNLYGTYSTVTYCSDRPTVPPRLGQTSLPRSEYEPSPPQTRPSLPPFSPPPPPSIETPSESVYSEIDYRPYLDILPEDDEDVMTQAGSTLNFGKRYQSNCFTSHQKTTADTEDINAMLRWLKRVSKSDYMAPSLYGLSLEEEIRSFNQRALNLRKALRLYNLLMMKRNECLRDLIAEFRSISHSLDKMQKKTKTMGIAGGTTGAVGGVTAVLGIALAPVTMGTSLIATAVGAGMVASAGGMGAHAAKANKKIVSRMAVEKLVYNYKEKIVDLEQCLDFILCEMNELRRHDIPRLQRAGAQTDALKMAHLSQFVIKNNMNNARKASAGVSSERLLQAFAKEMDLYFTEKDGEKLKKSRESRFSGRVRLLAENLQDELDHLNRMWEMFS